MKGLQIKYARVKTATILFKSISLQRLRSDTKQTVARE